MPVSSQTHSRRAFIADTTALILFFTTTGVINERFIAGMTWEQVLHARLLGAALMVPVGRPYGLWRDWLMQRARPDRLSQLLWDSLALGVRSRDEVVRVDLERGGIVLPGVADGLERCPPS